MQQLCACASGTHWKLNVINRHVQQHAEILLSQSSTEEQRPQSPEESFRNLTPSQCEFFWELFFVTLSDHWHYYSTKLCLACTSTKRIWNPPQLNRITLKTANYMLLANLVSLHNEELSNVTSKGLFSADRSQEMNFHIPRSYTALQDACKVYIMFILKLMIINGILLP